MSSNDEYQAFIAKQRADSNAASAYAAASQARANEVAAKNKAANLAAENAALKAKAKPSPHEPWIKELDKAYGLVAEWQASMEAWKALALALRDEIKDCPNHEAHKFGKNRDSRAHFANNIEDEERAKRNRPPLYTNEQKGIKP